MQPILPAHPVVVVSCHLERPLADDTWRSCLELARSRPGGFPVLWLVRPPHDGEDEELWLARAREIAALGGFGHHTHWTSPTHARPTGEVDPAARVREEAAWLRQHGLHATHFCGGAWYTDGDVKQAVAELGYIDCTPRGGGPTERTLPTTHTIGRLARAAATRRLPRYLHAYFHDYDLLDRRRRLALVSSLRLLRLRGARPYDYDVSAASSP
jgi:hypothetical protein